MLERLDMEFDGCPHSGLDDSRNIARVLGRMVADGAVLKVNEMLDLEGSERMGEAGRRSSGGVAGGGGGGGGGGGAELRPVSSTSLPSLAPRQRFGYAPAGKLPRAARNYSYSRKCRTN